MDISPLSLKLSMWQYPLLFFLNVCSYHTQHCILEVLFLIAVSQMSYFQVVEFHMIYAWLYNLFNFHAVICEYLKCVDIHSFSWSVWIWTWDFFIGGLYANHWPALCLKVTYMLNIHLCNSIWSLTCHVWSITLDPSLLTCHSRTIIQESI